MKNKVFLFLLMVSFACSCNAKVAVPEWKDVSPAMYSNIDTEKTYKLPIKQYWQERKIKFEAGLASCNEQFQNEELEKCYDALVTLEKSKNKIRETILIENSRSILK